MTAVAATTYDSKVWSIINSSVLDVRYIHNLTENLSAIVFRSYNESAREIAKGREFGTVGERAAAKILFDNMTKLGLRTWTEQLANTPRTASPESLIASKVDVLSKGLTIRHNGTIIPIREFYIGPQYNLTAVRDLIPNHPLALRLILAFLSTVFPRGFSEQRLTHNFSYTNLKVILKPYNYSLTTLSRSCEDFMYIARDYSYCNWPSPQPKLRFSGFLFNHTIFRYLKDVEPVIWALFQPHCRGIIYVNSNKNTFNCNPSVYEPLPKIYVNGSVGLDILEHPDDYRVDFYCKQQWNETVNSSNVIGQIDVPGSTETVLVTGLYDCQWNQGTGDSAIGMSIVLGIAKYIKDHDIKPRCNLRFIGFSGEEYGLRGAWYYEALHRKENVSLVIDLNQLGFFWNQTCLHLSLYINNNTLNQTVAGIANRTNYTQRTGIDFRTKMRVDGGPPTNARVFANVTQRGLHTYYTVEIVKDGPWYLHHKDGRDHYEGDVLVNGPVSTISIGTTRVSPARWRGTSLETSPSTSRV
jgi:hypothetical protein